MLKDARAIVESAAETVLLEAGQLVASANKIDESFGKLCQALHNDDCRVVVTGIGKSGHIGRKIAATLASTGTRSFFVHSTEAGHGDLGMISSDDALLALSQSGETEEVVSLAQHCKRQGIMIIGMTGNPSSALAQQADWIINSSVEMEACPHNIAPTSSTTLQLALGDALAIALLKMKGFSALDFGRTHPSGSLGRRLFLRVKDIMQPLSSVPVCPPGISLVDAVCTMAESRVGALICNEDSGELAGIFTDSDLRRLLARDPHILTDPPKLTTVMNRAPLVIPEDNLASSALVAFEQDRISRLICIDNEKKATGLLSMFDLLANKIA